MEGEEGEGYFKHGKVFVLLSSHHHLPHLPAYLPKTSLKAILLLRLRCKEGPDSHICVAVMQHRDLLHRREDPKKEILRLCNVPTYFPSLKLTEIMEERWTSM